MLTTDLPIVSFSKFTQPLKASLPISLTPLPITTLLSAVQPSNEPSDKLTLSSLTTLSGITTSLMATQPAKAPLPIT